MPVSVRSTLLLLGICVRSQRQSSGYDPGADDVLSASAGETRPDLATSDSRRCAALAKQRAVVRSAALPVCGRVPDVSEARCAANAPEVSCEKRDAKRDEREQLTGYGVYSRATGAFRQLHRVR